MPPLVDLERQHERNQPAQQQNTGQKIGWQSISVRFEARHAPDDEPDGECTHGHVHVEDPAPTLDAGDPPAGEIRQQPSDEGAEHRGDAEHGSHEALIFSPFGRCEQVGDHDEGHRENAAAPGALDPAEQNELGHAVSEEREVPELAGETTEHGTTEKETHRTQRDVFARVGVGEFPVDESQRRRGEQVGSGYPGVPIDPLQGLDHLGQRRSAMRMER